MVTKIFVLLVLSGVYLRYLWRVSGSKPLCTRCQFLRSSLPSKFPSGNFGPWASGDIWIVQFTKVSQFTINWLKNNKKVKKLTTSWRISSRERFGGRFASGIDDTEELPPPSVLKERESGESASRKRDFRARTTISGLFRSRLVSIISSFAWIGGSTSGSGSFSESESCKKSISIYNNYVFKGTFTF